MNQFRSTNIIEDLSSTEEEKNSRSPPKGNKVHPEFSTSSTSIASSPVKKHTAQPKHIVDEGNKKEQKVASIVKNAELQEDSNVKLNTLEPNENISDQSSNNDETIPQTSKQQQSDDKDGGDITSDVKEESKDDVFKTNEEIPESTNDPEISKTSTKKEFETTMINNLNDQTENQANSVGKRYIYTTANPCFNFNIFIEQLFQHVFYPLSSIYMYRKYGKTAVVNQTMWSPLYFIMVNMYWIIIVILITSHEHLNQNGVTTSEVLVSFLAGTVFRTVISSKYASMTQEEYIKFLTCENYETVQEMQSQMQLLTGWFFVDYSFCLHEAKLALKRMGFYDKNPCPKFEVKEVDIPKWKTMLGNTNGPLLHVGLSHKIGYVTIECEELMALIISSYNPKIKPDYVDLIETPFALAFSLIPAVLRVNCHKLVDAFLDDLTIEESEDVCASNLFLGNGHLAKSTSVLVILHSSFVIVPLTMFFIVTFLGNIRHYHTCKAYGMLMRADPFSPPEDIYPILDMNIPNNIRAWMRSRLGLQFFGRRYYQRMDIYAKLCAFILVFLMVWLYVYSKQTVSGDQGANQLIVDVKYWVVCYLVVVWGGCFALTLGVLAATNNELRDQELDFVLHRLSVKEKRSCMHFKPQNKDTLSPDNTTTHHDNITGTTSGRRSRRSDLLQVLSNSTLSQTNSDDARKTMMADEKVLEDNKVSNAITPPIDGDGATVKKDVDSNLSGKSTAECKSHSRIVDETNNETAVNVSTAIQQLIESNHLKEEALKKVLFEFQEKEDEVLAYEELDDLIDSAVMIAESQMRICPRRFLGADASWGLLIQYVGVWATLIGFTLTVAGIDYST